MVAQAVVCSSYGGFSGGAPPDATGLTHHHNLGSSLPSSMAPGNPGMLSVGSHVPSSLGGAAAGRRGGGLGGSVEPSSQFGGPGAGGYESFGMGSSPYCVPPSSAGMPSGGYPVSPGRRIPGRGLYPNVPPSY
ncbi:hypothetical protein BHE74_00037139 [Ensete ventricosum]|nr:hypothetical protein GW17_00010677 [Ensete ventricosum]RWW56162.1 hypothetical protein BHE74_00037139 [Ensete ventricosum]RZS02065.1 hypothetical protein BHM03_00032034 [Ensete ventricosum]